MRLSKALGLCPTVFHKTGSRRENSARVGMMSQLYQRLLASSSRRASRCGIFGLTSRLNLVPDSMLCLCSEQRAKPHPVRAGIQTFARIIAPRMALDGDHPVNAEQFGGVGPGMTGREAGALRHRAEFIHAVLAGNLGKDGFALAEAEALAAYMHKLRGQTFDVHLYPAQGLVVEGPVAKSLQLEIPAQ